MLTEAEKNNSRYNDNKKRHDKYLRLLWMEETL